jgi:hypothetical protein
MQLLNLVAWNQFLQNAHTSAAVYCCYLPIIKYSTATSEQKYQVLGYYIYWRLSFELAPRKAPLLHSLRQNSITGKLIGTMPVCSETDGISCTLFTFLAMQDRKHQILHQVFTRFALLLELKDSNADWTPFSSHYPRQYTPTNTLQAACVYKWLEDTFIYLALYSAYSFGFVVSLLCSDVFLQSLMTVTSNKIAKSESYFIYPLTFILLPV